MTKQLATQPGPELQMRQAVSQQIAHEIDVLSKHESVRLMAYAQNRISRIGPHAANGRMADDLLHEAVTRLLDGTRNWNPENVDIAKCLIGTMRSIASAWAAHRKRNAGRPEYAALESGSGNAGEPEHCRSPLDMVKAAGLNVEEMAIEKEIEAERKALADEISASCIGDRTASMVIVRFESGMDGPAIQEDLGWTPSEYRTTVRRIQRRANKIAENRHGR
jgi:hypothetical protein